jgi:hypothetical protein
VGLYSFEGSTDLDQGLSKATPLQHSEVKLAQDEDDGWKEWPFCCIKGLNMDHGHREEVSP